MGVKPVCIGFYLWNLMEKVNSEVFHLDTASPSTALVKQTSLPWCEEAWQAASYIQFEGWKAVATAAFCPLPAMPAAAAP